MDIVTFCFTGVFMLLGVIEVIALIAVMILMLAICVAVVGISAHEACKMIGKRLSCIWSLGFAVSLFSALAGFVYGIGSTSSCWLDF